MHLIAPLMAGMNGAQAGYARLFRRGTSTRATWYASFEGDGADATGADIALDEHGRAEVYVDEYIDVSVLDSGGVQIANFTAGHSATAVEYKGQSFTGTDYDTAASAAGNPVTVQEALNRWKDSAGSIDFRVLFDGSSTNLQTVLSALLGLVYNVKSADYGAVGDGVADDTAAVQAAIDAAEADGGGIVYLPRGLYRTTDTLDFKSGVSVVGAGPESCVIALDTATSTTPMWDVGEASNQFDIMAGFAGIFLQANTSAFVDITAAAKLRLRDLEFDVSTSTSATCVTSTVACEIDASQCVFKGKAASLTHASTKAWIRGCEIVAQEAGADQSLINGVGIHVRDSAFDNSNVTTNTTTCYASSTASVSGTVVGCEFQNGGGGTIVCMDIGTYDANANFLEEANVFGSSVTAYEYMHDVFTSPRGAIVRLNSREERRYEEINESAMIPGAVMEPLLKQYGIVVIRRETSTDQVIELTSSSGDTQGPPDGSRSLVVVHNDSGGTITTERIDLVTPPPITLTSYSNLGNQWAAVLSLTLVAMDGGEVAYAITGDNTGIAT